MPKGIEKRIITIGFWHFVFVPFTFEVFSEFFSLSFRALARIKLIVTHFRPFYQRRIGKLQGHLELRILEFEK